MTATEVIAVATGAPRFAHLLVIGSSPHHDPPCQLRAYRNELTRRHLSENRRTIPNVTAWCSSELCGVVKPADNRTYFSSQRGTTGPSSGGIAPRDQQLLPHHHLDLPRLFAPLSARHRRRAIDDFCSHFVPELAAAINQPTDHDPRAAR